jgi:hypothetical protein
MWHTQTTIRDRRVRRQTAAVQPVVIGFVDARAKYQTSRFCGREAMSGPDL